VTGVVFDNNGAARCKGTRGVATELAKGKGKVSGSKNGDRPERHISANQARVANRRQTRQCLIDFGGQQPASLEFLGEKTQLETGAGDFSDQAVSPQCRLLMRKLSQ
jgi:hypothetical protein